MPSDTLLTEWGARLRVIRTGQGLGVSELARRADVNRQYIYRLENGEATPSDDIRMRLAAALGVAVTDVWTYPTDVAS